MNTRSHVESMDRLIDVFEKRAQSEEFYYKSNLDYVLTTTDDEIQKINNNNDEDETFLKQIMFSMQKELDQLLMKTNADCLGISFMFNKVN